jgi:D-lactate dehydrogenase
MAGRLADSLRRWTDEGALPVVVDAASCTHGVVAEVAALDGVDLAGIEVIDAVAWAHDHLLPRLEVLSPVASATVHPTCSTRHLGLAPRLEALARAAAAEVHVPIVATCCGMAGDRGLLHPELTESATRAEAAEVTARGFDAHVSSNRTCEIGLERATGRPYESVVQLLERVTRPAGG